MKKLIVCSFLFFSFFANSQTYEYGACFANGLFFKNVGTLIIDDKKVIFQGATSFEYTVINKANGLLYFTDGVMTHFLTFTSMSGKKKWFEYDIVIVWNYDSKQNLTPCSYYCKLLK